MTALRSLDWRFLLGGHDRSVAVILGASPETLEVAHRVGLADIVVAQLPDEPVADLVAVLATAHGGESRSVGDVAERLAPGGQLYVEVDRRRAWRKGAISVTRALRDCGLTIDGAWAVRPAFDRCETFVSLVHPAPLPWFIEQQYEARSRWQRVARDLLHVLVGGDGRRFLRWSPYTAIVASSSQRIAESRPPEMLLVDGGNRAVVLEFPADSAEPTVVVKIPKLPSFENRTVHEHQTLTALHTMLPPRIAATIPQPIRIDRWGRVRATTESVLLGERLSRRCLARTPARAAQDLNDAARWLLEFSSASCSRKQMSDADFDRWFSTPCGRYVELFGSTEQHLLDAARHRGRLLHQVSPLPVVTRHRDFNIWNLLRLSDDSTDDRPDIGVIDWEGAEAGPPLTDLVHLCTHWHEAVRRARPVSPDPEGLRRIVVERRRAEFPDAEVANVFDRAFEMLEIDHGWFPVLVVATWVELALRRDRQQRDGSTLPAGQAIQLENGHRSDNVGVRYLEVLASQTDAMFDTESNP